MIRWKSGAIVKGRCGENVYKALGKNLPTVCWPHLFPKGDKAEADGPIAHFRDKVFHKLYTQALRDFKRGPLPPVNVQNLSLE